MAVICSGETTYGTSLFKCYESARVLYSYSGERHVDRYVVVELRTTCCTSDSFTAASRSDESNVIWERQQRDDIHLDQYSYRVRL
jgi:hypothetical protein